MKKLKRLAAVLLAGIMALALFTACSGSDPGNPEFDPKVESAYLDALNNTFGTSFENDADIKRLAIEHIEEKHGADSLTGSARCKTEGDEKTVVRQVQLCYDAKSSKPNAFVPLFYEAANTPNITPDKMSLRTLYYAVEQEIEAAKKNGRTLELTALGVGVKTIGGKTYVAIGFELTNTTP
ncbi:hypothetical protein L0P70_12005 [Faecalibacterium prausnitzii]|uniref:hypothetical protein n=1 Tax=Faecalibacterium prausnitzii TaxID=853 RepID=UPI001C262EB2|nr:hypothetical protein [Faecalibacterium prausnitzii]MBV0927635.1 hypothetical protein [Faecalibacterium prausnitzii]MCG4795398.1 hypothetical protein [Faecalibacterium prausnitzii]MCG4801426.1 hypothetical protein [Faecalibacterium prausnitzii]MCQ5163369.1 hypothetical protein [Faecalibacterium prausnitzii]MDE8723317.1 hypothetical protein [Faecalibacterium prausnitzii]